MRHIVSLSFLLLPLFLKSQAPDSIHLYQEIDSLVQLNRNLIGKQKFTQGLEIIQQAKQLSSSLPDTMHILYARCLFNYGRTWDRLDKAEEAEYYYLASLKIIEVLQGDHALDLAWSLNNLAGLYSLNARFEEAEPLYFRSLELRKKSLGTAHPDYFWSLHNLGDHYFKKGNYKQSELYQIQARDLREKHLGKEHADYASSLNNLAVLYKRMGRYADAELLYLEAITIREKQLGKQHTAYAVSLNNLANLYQEIKRYKEADSLYVEALQIWKNTLGEKHNHVAAATHNLATLRKKTGKYEEAREGYRQALSIWEAIYGKEHPQYAQGLSGLGELNESLGEFPAALDHYLEARSTRERALGKEHPDYANSQNSLGRLYWLMGNIPDALVPMKEAVSIQKKMMAHASAHLSEQEQIAYITRFDEIQDQYYSFIQINQNKIVEANGDCMDLTLFHKGYVLFASKQIRQRVQQNPAALKIYQQLNTIQRRLAKEYAKPLADRQEVVVLENKAQSLEKELLVYISDLQFLQQQVTWKQVQQTLKKGEALIEFIDYNLYNPEKKDSIMYSALVLLPGMTEPAFISLFEEKELDALLEFKVDRRSDFVNDLYAYADRGLVQLGQPKRSLYDMIWQRLEEFGLPEVHTIYYSSTGVLNRLNIGAIPINEEQILSDKYALVALGSTRQLMPSAHAISTVNNTSVAVFGGIQYDLDSLVLAANGIRLPGADVSTGNTGKRGGASWSFLKWTGKEALTVKSILENAAYTVAFYSDTVGTEEQVKALGFADDKLSPRVLHIASHGFFFPDQVSADKQPIPSRLEEELAFKVSDNPMIRSGLIMAGGNLVWTGGQALPGREDGILTAYEISQLDLQNTELVVLSACETGLGDILGNEGVYGLQRAFKIAGARYLIMSLWQVPDRETMEFMTTFYKNWLELNLSIPDAFRKTQREMRDRFFNPYSWGAFVLVE